ncbi:olfactory receptor 14K1-like [Tachyglossus aculeatus]|uniref:olfactory receptor 14K1-like n=1 Tax=Tachyglossus aculeatus TaxID=9261 RepID=UPI0018F6A9B7|nr:olfactory receptor 14K1-like [Tachyglossus aculeatus]
MAKVSTVTEFLLLGFSEGSWELQLNPSFRDVCYISITVPKSILTSLANNSLISLQSCVTQLFLIIFFVAAELSVLTAVFYDCYVAICHPLRYELIMDRAVCVYRQFFCDAPSLLKSSRFKRYVVLDASFAIGLVFALISFTPITVSYIHISWAMLRMPAIESRDSPSALDLLVSDFYIAGPSALNPHIYNLRKRDIKAALGRVLEGHPFPQKKSSMN